MRATICRLIISVLIAAAAGTILARQSTGKSHILLFDISGSMRGRYDNGLKDWLIRPLLDSSVFDRRDRVIVRWFHSRPDTRFSTNDPERTYDGPQDRQAVLSAVPTTQQAVRPHTNLPQAIELALSDIDGLRIAGEVLIWLVTDNVQDMGGQGNTADLYNKIVAIQNIRAAYIFPLVKENGRLLPQGKDAMVMYLLHYSPQAPKTASVFDRYADEAGRKIDNDPIAWFPIGRGLKLDESSITVNGQQARFIDGKLVLPPLPEGATPDYSIQFQFKSDLRGRRIVDGKIINPRAVISQRPASIEVEGDLNSLRAGVSPTSLAARTGQARPTVYDARVSGDFMLRPASFWDGMGGSTGEAVETSLQFSLADLKTDVDATVVSKVPNLSDIKNIKNILQLSQRGEPVVSIPMAFSVEFNTLWRRVLAGLAAFLAMGIVGAGASIFFAKSRYTLTTPGGEQSIELPLVGKAPVMINGDCAAVITKRFGKLLIAPAGSYLIDGEPHPRRLSEADSSFCVESQPDGKRYPYSFRRAVETARQPLAEDEFLR